jgi:hypothetical protein
MASVIDDNRARLIGPRRQALFGATAAAEKPAPQQEHSGTAN